MPILACTLLYLFMLIKNKIDLIFFKFNFHSNLNFTITIRIAETNDSHLNKLIREFLIQHDEWSTTIALYFSQQTHTHTHKHFFLNFKSIKKQKVTLHESFFPVGSPAHICSSLSMFWFTARHHDVSRTSTVTCISSSDELTGNKNQHPLKIIKKAIKKRINSQ